MSIDWVPLPLGSAAIASHGTPVPEETKQALAGLHGWYLGPHDSVGYPEPHNGTGEFMPTPDTAIMMGIVTREATERVARVAFDLARSRRKKLTIVHKANVLKLTTGLFRTVCQEVAQDYPDVTPRRRSTPPPPPPSSRPSAQ